jgi:hypothetical protein
MFSSSRMRKFPWAETPVSCAPAGPRMPIEVFLMESSLSCWRVSRRACRPCVMSSSSEPTLARPIDHRLAMAIRVRRLEVTDNLRNSRNVFRDKSWHSDSWHRWTWQSTHMNYLRVRTRRGVGRFCRTRSRGNQHHTVCARTPEC